MNAAAKWKLDYQKELQGLHVVVDRGRLQDWDSVGRKNVYANGKLLLSFSDKERPTLCLFSEIGK